VPSGFFSGGFTSDALLSDSDTVIGGVQAPPSLRYVVSLLPVYLSQYAAGHMALASQDHSQDLPHNHRYDLFT
jgi:hypothetical protein